MKNCVNLVFSAMVYAPLEKTFEIARHRPIGFVIELKRLFCRFLYRHIF